MEDGCFNGWCGGWLWGFAADLCESGSSHPWIDFVLQFPWLLLSHFRYRCIALVVRWRRRWKNGDGEVHRWWRLAAVDGSHRCRHGAGPGAWSSLHLRDGAEGWRWWSCGAGDWRREWRLPQLTWWRLLGFPREEARVEDDDVARPYCSHACVRINATWNVLIRQI